MGAGVQLGGGGLVVVVAALLSVTCLCTSQRAGGELLLSSALLSRRLFFFFFSFVKNNHFIFDFKFLCLSFDGVCQLPGSGVFKLPSMFTRTTPRAVQAGDGGGCGGGVGGGVVCLYGSACRAHDRAEVDLTTASTGQQVQSLKGQKVARG